MMLGSGARDIPGDSREASQYRAEPFRELTPDEWLDQLEIECQFMRGLPRIEPSQSEGSDPVAH
jgi:hypothetical protein